MDHFEHVIAEQSVYAYLTVEPQISELTQFQNTVQKIYSFAKTGITPLTSVDPDLYSITNLPNTIPYLPNNTIFKNILLIRSDDPDFRFVKISDERNIFERMQEPSIISDNNFINVRLQQKELEDQARNSQQSKQPLLIPIGEFTTLSQEQPQIQPNVTDETYDDPKFSNFTTVEALYNFSALEMQVNALIRRPPESQNTVDWSADLFNTYSFPKNLIDSVLENRNQHYNNTTVKIRIIDYLGHREKTNMTTPEQMLNIKSLIDTFIQSL